MRPYRFLALGLLALCAVAPARAQYTADPLDPVVEAARTPAAVRAALVAYADSVRASQPDVAARAWRRVGESFARAGRPDSALVAYTTACEQQAGAPCWVGHAEALAAHGRGGLTAALQFVSGLPDRAGGEEGVPGEQMRLWLGLVRTQRHDAVRMRTAINTVLRALRRAEPPLERRVLWMRRYGYALAALDAPTTWTILAPLVVDSRGRDSTVRVLARATSRNLMTQPFDAWLTGEVARADRGVDSTLRLHGARPLTVRAADGFPLRAWFVPATAPHAPLVALLAAPPTDADSLVDQLHRAGCAVALLEPRGTGGSIAPGCTCVDDWLGREDAMTLTVARDLVACVRAALLAGGGDPARLAVGAAGPFAEVAVVTAREDRRLRAILLATPQVAPVARGPMVGTLAACGTPAFIQTGAGDRAGDLVVDRLVALLPGRQTRVAEVPGAADGYALFHAGADAGARFTSWLRDAWALPPATPRPPRR